MPRAASLSSELATATPGRRTPSPPPPSLSPPCSSSTPPSSNPASLLSAASPPVAETPAASPPPASPAFLGSSPLSLYAPSPISTASPLLLSPPDPSPPPLPSPPPPASPPRRVCDPHLTPVTWDTIQHLDTDVRYDVEEGVVISLQIHEAAFPAVLAARIMQMAFLRFLDPAHETASHQSVELYVRWTTFRERWVREHYRSSNHASSSSSVQTRSQAARNQAARMAEMQSRSSDGLVRRRPTPGTPPPTASDEEKHKSIANLAKRPAVALVDIVSPGNYYKDYEYVWLEAAITRVEYFFVFDQGTEHEEKPRGKKKRPSKPTIVVGTRKKLTLPEGSKAEQYGRSWDGYPRTGVGEAPADMPRDAVAHKERYYKTVFSGDDVVTAYPFDTLGLTASQLLDLDVVDRILGDHTDDLRDAPQLRSSLAAAEARNKKLLQLIKNGRGGVATDDEIEQLLGPTDSGAPANRHSAGRGAQVREVGSRALRIGRRPPPRIAPGGSRHGKQAQAATAASPAEMGSEGKLPMYGPPHGPSRGPPRGPHDPEHRAASGSAPASSAAHARMASASRTAASSSHAPRRGVSISNPLRDLAQSSPDLRLLRSRQRTHVLGTSPPAGDGTNPERRENLTSTSRRTRRKTENARKRDDKK